MQDEIVDNHYSDHYGRQVTLPDTFYRLNDFTGTEHRGLKFNVSLLIT
jgi:hypothetical protein